MTEPIRLASLQLPDEIVEIARTLESAGYETWCVGGAIRDALLGRPREDVDLATQATPDEVQRVFRRTVPVGLKFGTVGVLDRSRRLHEVTTFRRDVATDGRHAEVEYGVSLDDDLARRDFTVNAIAYHPIRGEWRDPFGGADDLATGVIRAVGDPKARFREDYLRVLRALRFAARLEFSIEPATFAAARDAAPGLARLSAERVRDEWVRSLETARSLARLVELWHESGAAAVTLPELTADYGLASDDPELRDPVLLTVALTTDPSAVLERLRLSNADIARARRVLASPPAPSAASPGAVRRWMSEVSTGADDLLALHQLRTGRAAPWAQTVLGIRERGEPLTRGDLAISGDDLQGAGVSVGPEVGRLLAALLEAVLEDPTLNQRERLLDRLTQLRQRDG